MSFSEYSVLRFRCSRSGRHFVSVFGRYSPAHRFQFVENREGSPPADTETSASPSGLAQKLVGFAQLMKTKAPALLSASSALLRSDRPGSAQIDAAPVRAEGPKLVPGSLQGDAMDFAGWHCLYCSHGRTGGTPSLFLRCGRCGDYICGARVRRVGDETLFACHDECGETGAVKGNITSYNGATVDARSGRALKGEEQKRLQPPPPSTLVKKKD